MPAKPRATRETVVQLKISSRLTWSQIVKQTGVKERTAKRWWQQWRDDRKLDHNIQPGRPRSVRIPRNIKRIARASKGKKRISIRKLVKRLDGVGSRSTGHRMLRGDLGYKLVRIKKRVKLTASQKDHRLRTAKFQLANNVKIEDVAFSDEKRFLLNPKPGRHEYVWTDDVHEESVYSDTPKYSSGSVEVWGAITFYGKVDLVFIERPMEKGAKRKFKAEDYIGQILEKRVPQLDKLFKEHGHNEWWFQQDRDSKHTAKKTQDWLQRYVPHFVKKNQWPANSPDINLIENLWKQMDDAVKSRQATTLNGLK